ncbi:MAG: hypothetical protein FWF24_06720, partial [Alphaproteobacteria bacterium]|nr:hypothetical protein [Alphaproteobacteria bacterium]
WKKTQKNPPPFFFYLIKKILTPPPPPPQNICLVDDSQENIDAAKKRGWSGYLFTNMADFECSTN